MKDSKRRGPVQGHIALHPLSAETQNTKKLTTKVGYILEFGAFFFPLGIPKVRKDVSLVDSDTFLQSLQSCSLLSKNGFIHH